MLNTSKFGTNSVLDSALSSAQTVMQLPVGHGARYQPLPAGDYFYLTIRDGNTFEQVKVTNVVNDKLTIVRAQGGTTAQAFSKGSCVKFEITPLMICEIASQCGAKTISTEKISGTFCLDCTTCIELTDSLVTAINPRPKC